MTGPILTGTATGRYPLATRGVTARECVQHWELIFPVSIAKRKMCTFKTYTVGNVVGWVFLTSTQKGRSFGATPHLLISVTGQNTNQITSVMKTAFTLLGQLRAMSTNGMMSIVQTVTNTLARKVSVASLRLRAAR